MLLALLCLAPKTLRGNSLEQSPHEAHTLLTAAHDLKACHLLTVTATLSCAMCPAQMLRSNTWRTRADRSPRMLCRLTTETGACHTLDRTKPGPSSTAPSNFPSS